jgi:2-haloacid dehalogenase
MHARTLASISIRDGLEIMRDAGLRLVTLTNNPPDSVKQQLTNAGLASLFEGTFSVDTVRRFMPATEAHRCVADALGVRIDQWRMVAAHAWDVLGGAARRVRCGICGLPGKRSVPAWTPAGHRRSRLRVGRARDRWRGIGLTWVTDIR